MVGLIELRDAGTYWSLSGFATTYGRSYFVGHGDGRSPFRETILPGAFSNATSSHVELRVEHDAAGPVLASTSGRTMSFEDDQAGLILGAALAKRSRDAQDAARRINAGELRSFSVGMFVPEGGDHWPAVNERHVVRAELSEVSLVARPCNDGAVVTDFRAETRSAGLEIRMVPLTAYRQDLESIDGEPDEDDRCPNCGTDLDGDEAFCPQCGVELSDDTSSGLLPIGNTPRATRRRFSAADRKRLAAKGWALSDGSYPVETVGDLRNAIAAFGRNPTERVRSHIVRQARRLGRTDLLPDSWAVRRAVLEPNDNDLLIERFELARVRALG